MAPKLDRVLNLTAFTFLSIILFCLVLLTPADAIYQCYVTKRLINVFFIAGAYIVTFLLAVLIYATRIYTNRSVLTGIPKAWIPVEKEDVATSVRRLVMEGFARSSIIAHQARPRDIAATDGGDGHDFSNYPTLLVDQTRPPWGRRIDHPGWSSPASLDLPDLPYRTVLQELPHLIEAKAVSLAPPDPFLTLSSYRSDAAGQPIPDTRVVEVLQRPASMGLREYLHHLTALEVIQPPEIGTEFVGLYERARFSAHELFEDEFRELMHVFAEVLRGMQSLGASVLDGIRGTSSTRSNSSSRDDTESVIGPSDEEGETDTVEDSEMTLSFRGRSSLRPSIVSSEDHSERRPYSRLVIPRTPSMRSNVSGSSGGSVIRLTEPRGPSDLPYVFGQ